MTSFSDEIYDGLPTILTFSHIGFEAKQEMKLYYNIVHKTFNIIFKCTIPLSQIFHFNRIEHKGNG